MVHPNVALIRRGYEAFNSGDVTTLSQVIAEDAVQYAPGSHPLSGAHKGLETILAYYGRIAELTGGTFAAELLHCMPDSSGHVMAVHRVTATRGGRGLNQMGGIFFTIVNNQAVELQQCDEDLDVSNAFFG